VFVPLLSNPANQKKWPPVVAQDIQKHVHSLKSTVYQVKGQVSGQTVLPMPVGVERVHEAERKLIERYDKMSKVLESRKVKAKMM
jgi:dynein heavy chain